MRGLGTAARALTFAAAALLLSGSPTEANASSTSRDAASWQPLALVTTAPILASSDESASGAATDADAAAERVRRAESPKKGGRKALLLSLLLPGMGEMSLGEKGRATGFFVAEGAIWTHFVWFQVAGHLRKDNYIEQAQRHAGITVSDADDTYWKLLGQYQTSQGTGPDAYEEALRREARDNFPGDPAAQDAYVAERLPTGGSAWSWSSEQAQTGYRETRESSRRAYDRSKYSIAAAIVNRIVSAIDTQVIRKRAGEKVSRSETPGTPLLLLADTAPDGSGRLYLTRSF